MELDVVEGSAAAKEDTTAEGRRERGRLDGEGGERRERAASTGGGALRVSDVGVSQNM